MTKWIDFRGGIRTDINKELSSCNKAQIQEIFELFQIAIDAKKEEDQNDSEKEI